VDHRFTMPASTLSTHWLLYRLAQTVRFAGGRLLDVGCGRKPYRALFGAPTHLGVDWPNSLHQLSIDAAASAETLPFGASAFDTVLCTEVIEHLRHPAGAIEEMARVLKPGGHLILSAPFVHEIHEAPYDFYRFTAIGLVRLVEDAGLAPVALLPRGGYLTVVADLIARILLRWIRAGLRRLPLPKVAQNAVVHLLIVSPLRGFALIALAAESYTGHSSQAMDMDVAAGLTLGYVLVARRPDRDGDAVDG
jgi:SAM-dependent methyltransferase